MVPESPAVEGCNGLNMDAMNQRAIESAHILGIPYTGGSDAHEPRHVGDCHTLFTGRVTTEKLLDLLRAGNYRGVDMRKPSRSWIPGSR